MTDQQTPLDIDSILDDFATQIGQHVKEKTIMMAQVRRLASQLEEVTKERDELLIKTRQAPEEVTDDGRE